jgi:DNA-binding NarL/FixJ family response regulator
MPRVLLVDDRSLSLAGLRSILDSENNVTVVGEALEGEQALTLVEELHPDVVVIDALAYRIDAVELAGRMARKFGVGVPAIMLLANVPEDRLLETFRSGVRALLLRQSSSDELIAAVQMVAAGYVLMAPSQVPSIGLRGALTDPDEWAANGGLEGLTGREFDVLELVARGLSNSEISDELSVSESTVKSHVRSTLAKLGLRNRVQLVILAYRLGLAGRRCGVSAEDPERWRVRATVGPDLSCVTDRAE